LKIAQSQVAFNQPDEQRDDPAVEKIDQELFHAVVQEYALPDVHIGP